MRDTSLNATGRNNCVKAVGNIVNDLMGGGGFLNKIQDAFKLLDETVTGCDNDCDDVGRLEVCANGYDTYRLLCPRMNPECAYGNKLFARARNYALNSLKDIIPGLIQKNMLNPINKFTLQRAEQWNFEGVLYIYGDSGVGKSFCAAWLLYKRKLKRCMDKWNDEGAWDRSGGIAWVSAYSAVDKTNFEMVKTVPILVLDALGTEAPGAGNKAAIAEIISKRYDNDIPTIITSVIPPDKLDYYGIRVYDRVYNNGALIEFSGESLRVKNPLGLY